MDIAAPGQKEVSGPLTCTPNPPERVLKGYSAVTHFTGGSGSGEMLVTYIIFDINWDSFV